jgi:hypothetical protein
MPLFMTVHRAPGLSREDVAGNALPVMKAEIAVFRHMYANLSSGFMLSIFEADSREKVEEQLEILGFPIDEMHEVQFGQSRAEMEQMLKHMGKL